MALSYQNFDVEIGRTVEGYVIRAQSPTGRARAPFAVPLTPEEVQALGNSVVRGARSGRAAETRQEPEDLKAYGQRLFDSVFTDQVLTRYQTSIEDVRRSTKKGLRIRFRLGEAPELAQIPWEYLFDGGSNRFIALDDETPLVRYLDLPFPSAPLQVEGPLRVLVVISSPSDLASLEVQLEWERLNEALADLIGSGRVELELAERATLSALRWKLREREYHVLHFIGHGGVDPDSGRGLLMLESDDGASDPVDAEVIAGIVSAEKSLRLVMLNACEGARASASDLFTGTAQTLVQQDVPAVIAMQFEISDEAAISLSHDFYKALAYGDPIDAALTEARRGLRWVKRNQVEWGTPVLYTRVEDGRLFEVKPPAFTLMPGDGVAVLFKAGAAHEKAGRYGEALEAFREVRDLMGPDHEGVGARIAKLEAKLERRRLLLRIGKLAAAAAVILFLGTFAMQNWTRPAPGNETGPLPTEVTPDGREGPDPGADPVDSIDVEPPPEPRPGLPLPLQPTADELRTLNGVFGLVDWREERHEWAIADALLLEGMASAASLLGAYPEADTLRDLREAMARRRQELRRSCLALEQVLGTPCSLPH